MQNNFSLSSPVKIKRYGQHIPDACVDGYGGKLSKSLGEFLKNKNVGVGEKLATGLSVKYPGYYGTKLVEKRIGRELDSREVIEIRNLMNSIYAKRRFSPVSVAHALRRGTSLEGVSQNLKGLLSKKVRRK